MSQIETEILTDHKTNQLTTQRNEETGKVIYKRKRE